MSGTTSGVEPLEATHVAPVDVRRRTTTRWTRSRLTRLAAFVVLVTGSYAFELPALLRAVPHRYAATLPRVEAKRERDGMSYALRWPRTSHPSLVTLGPAPTPVSVAYSIADEERTHLFLYETTGAMTLASVDRGTGEITERTLPETHLVYAARFDRRDPDVMWIATCLVGGLLRFDTRTGHVERVLTLEDESHVFALDQADDGTLYLGTYPHCRLLHVTERDGTWSGEPIELPADLVAERPYLHGLFVAGDSLVLHLGSPGRLLSFGLKSREFALLHDSPDAFLTFNADANGLEAGDSDERFHFDRNGPVDAITTEWPAAIAAVNGIATVETSGDPIEVPLFPRHGGMRITSLERGPDGRVYGGTYWNTWLFRVDADAGCVTGLGSLPEGCGEFFTTASLGDELVIPNYQGDVYRFPTSETERTPAVEKWAHVPEAHYGLSAVTLGERVVVATHPNYDQPGGMLYAIDDRGETTIRDRLDDDATIGALTVSRGRLFGGTIPRRGMGLGPADAKSHRSEIVELDPRTLKTRSRTPVGSAGDEIVGLVPLPNGDLLCGTKRRLYRVRATDGRARAVVVSSFTHLRRVCSVGLTRLLPLDDGRVLLLAEDRLFAYDPDHDDVVHVARLPELFELAALDGDGHLVLARDAELSVLRAADLSAMLAAAGAVSE